MKKFSLILLAAFFGLFLFYPLALIVTGSIHVDAPTAATTTGKAATQIFSLEYYRIILSSPFYRQCMLNSFIMATITTTVCLLVSLPLAHLFLRYRFPGKKIFSVLLLLPLILPPFVGALGLKQMFSRFGSVNLLLSSVGIVDLHHPPDWFGDGGFFGITLMMSLHLYPIMFLSVQAAMANVDPSMKDAARNLGASSWNIFRTVTFPLSMPGIFAGSALVFVSAFTDLGVPLMFEFQATIPTQIFNFMSQPSSPSGLALVVLMLIFVGIIFGLGRWLGEGEYSMMGRAASTSDEESLPLFPSIVAILGLTALVSISALPHLGVILQSFSHRWFMTILPNYWSTSFYAEIFALDLTASSIRNSVLYSSLSCIVSAALGVWIAWLLARGTFRGKTLLDITAMIPLALPGIVLAFAYLAAFSQSPFNSIPWLSPRQDPTFLLVIAYAIHRLPYIVRAAYAGLQQTAASLEEASVNLGASGFQTLRKITAPLIAAHLAGGMILAFSFAMLDVSNGMILAQEEPAYPMTKAIFALVGRITPTSASVACALGVLAMLLLALSLILASRLMGNSLGRLFKT